MHEGLKRLYLRMSDSGECTILCVVQETQNMADEGVDR